MIALTLDIDWAPDQIVDDVLAVVDARGVPTTVFCTNYTKDRSGKSSNLRRLHPRHELGLHPDFQNTANYAAEWDGLLSLYPGVRGWRAHNGMTGWPIITQGVARGLRYEIYTAIFADYVAPCRVYSALDRYVVLTTAFLDANWLHDRSFSWSAADLPLRNYFGDESKLVVLGFHPNIVYYDMKSVEEYDRGKASYHSVDEDRSYRRRPVRGAMKLLMELLDSTPAAQFCTVSAFCEANGLL